MELHDLTATQIVAMVGKGEMSPVELVRALLARAEALEPSLQAWEVLDRDGALEAARAQEGPDAGQRLLRGVPLGVKDIFFTAGLPTASGSSTFRDFVPTYDAAAVERVRREGGIVMGKTVTVQWAFADPPRTRNPWHPERTPGGSSSGSAAAVAARVVPAALGSQTGGSVLRPASFCGIVGLKPTYGRVSRRGVTPSGWCIDHVGALARSVADVALLLQAVAGHDPGDPSSARVPVGDYQRAARETGKPPAVGLVSDYLAAANPEVAAHARDVAARLERAGATVREVALPRPLPFFVAMRHLINQVETADLHARTLRRHPDGYAPKITALVRVGELVPATLYLHAQRLRRQCRPLVEAMLAGVDCLLMPTVDVVAPDRGSTGSSAFQAVWSLFGFPAITLPTGLSGERLPFGTQLVSLPFAEETLLGAASWCETVLGPMPSPYDGTTQSR